MGLRARRGLLPSRCAWLQPRSSLTAGAGVQQSSSSWWDRAKAKPLWHPHQNGCPDAGQPWGGCTRSSALCWQGPGAAQTVGSASLVPLWLGRAQAFKNQAVQNKPSPCLAPSSRAVP